MLAKLTPNRLFSFDKQYANRPVTTAQPPNQPDGFVKVTQRRYKLRHRRPQGGLSVSPVVEGIHNHAHRNFKWLPWLLGKISYRPAGNHTIVTGEMSGCWLVVFSLNGTVCFGHIGTFQDQRHPMTQAAINSWKVAVNSGAIQPIRAFNPITVGNQTTKTFAAIDPLQNLFTIGLDMETPNFGPMPYKVIHVTQSIGGLTRPTFY